MLKRLPARAPRRAAPAPPALGVHTARLPRSHAPSLGRPTPRETLRFTSCHAPTPCTRQTERTRAALDRRSIRGIPSPVRRRAPLEHQRRVSLPRASVAVQPPQRPLAFPRATRVASCPSRAVVSSEQLLPRPPLPCATGWARRSRPHPSSVPKLTPCAP
jgi:hypothetical protein